MKNLLQKYLHLLRGRDRGTVAITFLLSFPILLTVIGVIVQYALLANAKLTVDRAVAAAARSAMTSLPTDPAIEPIDGPANVTKTARLILAPLSPTAIGASSESQRIADSLQQLGVPIARSFAQRYTFAENASVISWERIDSNGGIVSTDPTDYSRVAGGRIRLTVRYDFLLTVPGVKFVGRPDTIAGISGRFITLISTVDVQLSDGRAARSNANGDPW